MHMIVPVGHQFVWWPGWPLSIIKLISFVQS